MTRHQHTADEARARLVNSILNDSHTLKLSTADAEQRVFAVACDFAAQTCHDLNRPIADDEIATSVRVVLDRFSARIDTLVCAHGVAGDGLLVRQVPLEAEAIVRINLLATMRVAREVCRGAMLRQSSGCIINIGSVVGLRGSVGQGAYAASKAGLVGFTKSLARELAPKRVRVNVVSPGFIDTRMTRDLSDARRQTLLQQIPLARFGQADEVAEVVAFLASPAAAYMTGQELVIDGGMSA